MASLISAVSWVKKGVAAQHPAKYVLDDKELERVSALARIELEDARTELEKAHIAAKSMAERGPDDVMDDDAGNDDDDENWVECVPSYFFVYEFMFNSFVVKRMITQWMLMAQSQNLPKVPQTRTICLNIIWMIMIMIIRHLVQTFCSA
jgi:hypothetical protein